MLELIDVFYNYGGEKLLEGISFTVGENEVLCLLGPSGSGKSTILRIIAGFEKPISGSVLFNGKNIVDDPVYKRNFGLVFQDYALFPHMNVYENIAFGLKMHGTSGSDLNQKVRQALAQVGMENFSDRKVMELSGGEQQRVALARSLVVRPSLLMLDEPLGALDYSLRQNLILELKEILGKNGIPAIYVTHDQIEAMSLSDRIAILHGGRIIQTDTPERLFAHPVNIWCAEFLGFKNYVTGIVNGDGQICIRNFGKDICIPRPESGNFRDKNVKVLLKSGIINMSDQSDIPGKLDIDAVVLQNTYRGDYYDVLLKIDDHTEIIQRSTVKISPGAKVKVSFPENSLIVYENSLSN